jgi:hypothetical protein
MVKSVLATFLQYLPYMDFSEIPGFKFRELPYISYTVKKVSGFPVPSRDVTYQTLTLVEIILDQEEFGK